MANLSITVAGKLYTVAMPGWTKKLDLTAYVGKDLFLPDVKVQDVLAILPEFEDRHIRVFAGTYPDITLFVYKLQGEDLFHVKTTLCNLCGECCRGLNTEWHLGLDENGDCIYLVDNVCANPEGPPIGCLGSFGHKGKLHPLFGTVLQPLCVVEYGMTVIGV